MILLQLSMYLGLRLSLLKLGTAFDLSEFARTSDRELCVFKEAKCLPGGDLYWSSLFRVAPAHPNPAHRKPSGSQSRLRDTTVLYARLRHAHGS